MKTPVQMRGGDGVWRVESVSYETGEVVVHANRTLTETLDSDGNVIGNTGESASVRIPDAIIHQVMAMLGIHG